MFHASRNEGVQQKRHLEDTGIAKLPELLTPNSNETHMTGCPIQAKEKSSDEKHENRFPNETTRWQSCDQTMALAVTKVDDESLTSWKKCLNAFLLNKEDTEKRAGIVTKAQWDDKTKGKEE